MNNIEEIFRNSLKNIEAPYDPKAWEAMSKRLDQNLPVKNPKTSFKWTWVASGLIVIAVASYFAIQKNEPKTILADKSVQKKTEISTEKQIESKGKSGKQVAKINESEISQTANTRIENQIQFEKAHLIFNPSKIDTPIESISANALLGTPSDFKTPKTGTKYCENEIINIYNSNDLSLSLLSSNGFNAVIKENSSSNIELNPGDYFYNYTLNGKKEREFAFTVNPKVKADFYADEEMVFYKGLPVSNLSSVNTASKYTWLNDKGVVLSKEKSFDAHFFSKGNHYITLNIQAENGCESKITKNVRCEASYNLLAMNSFIPTSSNSKINTFLPYALLERNIPFTMQIIDPKTGQIVYETKNESEPWDGIDKRTQQLITPSTPYIWKVNLEKTEIGESKNYQGTITRFED